MASILKPLGDGFSFWDTLPNIQGEPVQRISDLRGAPNGDAWELLDVTRRDSELLIKIRAATAGRFTLYLEEEPFQKEDGHFRGGIQLDSSGEEERPDQLAPFIVRFQFPSVIQNYIRLVPLVPAFECRLNINSESPFTSLRAVETFSKKTDDLFYMSGAWIKDEKLHLIVNHHFTIVEFRLEYEDQIILDDYGKTTLKADVRAIEDHTPSGCTCERKGEVRSTIAFDLSQLGIKKIDKILLTGRMVLDTREIAKPEGQEEVLENYALSP